MKQLLELRDLASIRAHSNHQPHYYPIRLKNHFKCLVSVYFIHYCQKINIYPLYVVSTMRTKSRCHWSCRDAVLSWWLIDNSSRPTTKHSLFISKVSSVISLPVIIILKDLWHVPWESSHILPHSPYLMFFGRTTTSWFASLIPWSESAHSVKRVQNKLQAGSVSWMNTFWRLPCDYSVPLLLLLLFQLRLGVRHQPSCHTYNIDDVDEADNALKSQAQVVLTTLCAPGLSFSPTIKSTTIK